MGESEEGAAIEAAIGRADVAEREEGAHDATRSRAERETRAHVAGRVSTTRRRAHCR